MTTSVLVTGTSTGIGRATALLLASRGYHVFAGVRQLASAPTYSGSSGDITPLVLDITDRDSIRLAIGQIASATGEEGLGAVVNSAGEGYPGPIETIELDDLRAQLEVNLVGQVAVTQQVLPLLRTGRPGRVIFVGSIGGKFALEFGGPYHASKFALEGIADVLRQELHPDGIAVSIIEPGTVSTQIWKKAAERVDQMLSGDTLSGDGAIDRYRDRLNDFRESLADADSGGQHPDRVAAVIAKAIAARRPASRYPVGLAAHLGSRVKPFIPDRLYDQVARRLA